MSSAEKKTRLGFVHAIVELADVHVDDIGRLDCGKSLVGIGVGLFFIAGISEAETRVKLLELIADAKRKYDETGPEEGAV